MIVCHCHAVTERQIRAAVRAGAVSRREVSKACSAARSCGGCAHTVDQIIACESNGGPQALVPLPDLATAS